VTPASGSSAYPYIALITVGRAALFNYITAETRSLIHTQYSRYTADDHSDRAANDSAHRSRRAFTLAGTLFNASRHTLGRSVAADEQTLQKCRIAR
jgi:hypothetical protein